MTLTTRIELALHNPHLQRALDANYTRSQEKRNISMGALPDSDLVRDRARAIRLEALRNLDQYLVQLETQVTACGGVVHWAASAQDASAIVARIAKAARSRLVAKSKSMVSEEIHLNKRLQADGFEVVETDLGEYILQLRGDVPSHIVAPAIHLTRADVAETFEQQLGLPAGVTSAQLATDIPLLTSMARTALRKVFIEAGVGVSGVNFAVADTGALCLVSNEGNGRLVTSLPRVHIALMGIERVVPTMADLEVMLRVLSRSATGQNITCYTSVVCGPRRAQEPDGPAELHLVLVDNGRAAMLGGELAEALLCIRCGACLNVCPVYREIGGHAYGSVYPGPIGALVTPALGGMREFGELAQASSLCGACQEVCPVRIDIPTMLIKTRTLHLAATGGAPVWNAGLKMWSWAMRAPWMYQLGLRMAAWGAALLATAGPLRLPGPLAGWTDHREFPGIASTSFRARWAARQRSQNAKASAAAKRTDRWEF